MEAGSPPVAKPTGGRPLPRPPTTAAGRGPVVALATGLMLEPGTGPGRLKLPAVVAVVVMLLLPGATGSSRRLLLRCGRICMCCFPVGAFCGETAHRQITDTQVTQLPELTVN